MNKFIHDNFTAVAVLCAIASGFGSMFFLAYFNKLFLWIFGVLFIPTFVYKLLMEANPGNRSD